MTKLPPARAVYIDSGQDTVFGMFHETTATSSGMAVLICPPWGWDEVVSYRARRAWAEYLAAAGHPALRIDLPGTGDSGGLPGEPARVDAWIAAIVAASSWLAGSSEHGRIAVVGLGLGGLVACAALAAGAPIDDIVLWASPARGRTFLREQRAFARLQSSRFDETREPEPTGLPGDWIEVGGFVLSAETISALERLDVADMDMTPLRRALVLDRDGIAADPGWDRLAGSGIEISLASGTGWGAMCFHPERYYAPVDVFAQVDRWLARATSSSVDRSEPLSRDIPPMTAHADLVVDRHPVRETPMIVDQPFGRSFAILTEAVSSPRSDLCAVFLNAGAVRRIGPNRIWVEAARRWAARDVPTIQFDLEGIGDSDGSAAMYADVGPFYAEDRGLHLSAIVDSLESQGIGPQFVLIGLCSGGYWAFEAAARDDRVVGAVAINPRALVWTPDLDQRREARQIQRLLEPGAWRTILHGDAEVSHILSIGRAAVSQSGRMARRLPARLWDRTRADPVTAKLECMLDRLHETTTKLTLAFTSGEIVHDELDRDGILAQIDRWPNVELVRLPSHDHTVRPMAAQRAVHEVIDREIARLMAR